MQWLGQEGSDMRRKDAQPTRYPGVQRVADGYLVRVRAKDPRTGKPRQRERLVTGVSSPGEAARLREELRREIVEGGEQQAERVRLADYASSWLSGKRRTLKRSTLERYATALDLHVLPDLGDFYVDALTAADVSAWRDRQRAEPATVNSWLRVLKTLLEDAAQDLGLARNPAGRIRALPEPEAYTDDDPNALTAAELAKLLDAARRVAPTYFPLFATMAYTGMRPGEATALRWEDLDEEAGVLRIRRSQYRKTPGTTKTKKTRTVPLADPLAEILQEHRRELVARQSPGVATGWMFPSRTGDLRFTSTLRRPLQRACKAARIGRRFTPHGFRRTFNNLLRQVTTGTVQRAITGHSTERMSEHYSHVALAEKRAAAGAVVRLVSVGSADRSADASDGNESAGGSGSSDRR